jgi:hypothetical protein
VKIALILLVVVALLLILEFSLRLLFGFGNPLIYLADEKIGYLLAPNQKTRRFGNQIEINQYSMRSPAATQARPANTYRILLLGDSVANGGWWTDQQDTISVMLAKQLQADKKAKETQTEESQPNSTLNPHPSSLLVEVLNASANSWGPRNELAYLRRFGTFDAQAIVLLLNTDDLFATAPSSWAVGNDRNYPDHKPPLALWEVINRYVMPAPKGANEKPEPGDRVGFNLAAIEQIQAIAQQSNSRFVLAMTPLLRELGQPGPKDYEIKARQRLQEFAESKGITYIDFLPIFNGVSQPSQLYRDHIHLSPEGNRLVSNTLNQSVQLSL